MSEIDEIYVDKDKVIKYLEILIKNIRDDKYTVVTQQDIYDSIEEYVTEKIKPLDLKTMEYLFRGWWLTDMIGRTLNPSANTLEPLPISNCPFCLRPTITENMD
uniref:Uncharacterized protein n=1 Tax=Marseillevirus LCMAC102 TaxID=2506603 RepID=A0A481YTW0_9VIRU|nr:MAG: hypothetical protein LCMAC102_04440 [Marseillevirus LCMAC102]